jgi:hypothetical protein
MAFRTAFFAFPNQPDELKVAIEAAVELANKRDDLRVQVRGELALRGVFLGFEGGKRAASKVAWPSPDDVDHLLKLTRGEFGRDLVSRVVYVHQEYGCRNSRRHAILGGPFCPGAIQRDAVGVNHGRSISRRPAMRSSRTCSCLRAAATWDCLPGHALINA